MDGWSGGLGSDCSIRPFSLRRHFFRLTGPLTDRVLQITDEGFLERGGRVRLDDSFRRIAGQHLAGMHPRNAIAKLSLVHEMGGNENGDAILPGRTSKDLPEAILHHRIDAGSWLVNDEKIGVMDQGTT